MNYGQFIFNKLLAIFAKKKRALERGSTNLKSSSLDIFSQIAGFFGH
jgi:hypothetical protein